MRINGVEYSREQFPELAERLAQEWKANPPAWDTYPDWINEVGDQNNMMKNKEAVEFADLFLKAMGWWKERCHCEPCERFRANRPSRIAEFRDFLRANPLKDGEKVDPEWVHETFEAYVARREDEKCLIA